MNRNDFNRFVSGAALPGPGDIDAIKELAELFPWFHSAHLILLKGLKDNSDVRFDSQLKASALAVADREVLYHYLFLGHDEIQGETPATASDSGKEELPEETVVSEETASPGEAATEALPVSKETVETEGAQTAGQGTHEEETGADFEWNEVDVMTAVLSMDEEFEITEGKADAGPESAEMAGGEDTPGIDDTETGAGEPALRSDDSDTMAGEVALKSDDSETISDEEEVLEFIPDSRPVPPVSEKLLSQADLIDRFIRMNPRIERAGLSDSVPADDLSEPSAMEKGSFITETLAKIYISQGYYSKAINIYEKLSLQYPEKSTYFASRIEMIKELIK